MREGGYDRELLRIFKCPESEKRVLTKSNLCDGPILWRGLFLLFGRIRTKQINGINLFHKVYVYIGKSYDKKKK